MPLKIKRFLVNFKNLFPGTAESSLGGYRDKILGLDDPNDTLRYIIGLVVKLLLKFSIYVLKSLSQ